MAEGILRRLQYASTNINPGKAEVAMTFFCYHSVQNINFIFEGKDKENSHETP